MTILVTGADGQVGWEILRHAADAGITAVGLTRARLDITDRAAVADAVARISPRAIINAAAYTAVDRAESEPEAAFAANRNGPAHLAEACNAADIPLIHLSTDFVFGGDRDTPYKEGDPVAPANVYGASKLAGEEAVRRVLDRHVILRVSWVFGVHGSNFVKTMLSLARQHDTLRVIADRTGCPTPAAAIASAALAIVHDAEVASAATWGTFHYCGQPPTSWHGFARTIFTHAINLGLLDKIGTIEPVSGTTFPQPAPRPQHTVLNCEKWLRHFPHPLPSWENDLEAMLRELRNNELLQR